MKIEVIEKFLDKTNLEHTFKVGEVLVFEEARAKDVIARGLAKEVAEPASEEEEAAEVTPVEAKPRRGRKKND